MHGHWLKGYLRDGKEIEGGGGGGSGGILVCPMEYTETTVRATMKASDLFDADAVLFVNTFSPSSGRTNKSTIVCVEMSRQANGSYSFNVGTETEPFTLRAATGDDYPEAELPESDNPGGTTTG